MARGVCDVIPGIPALIDAAFLMFVTCLCVIPRLRAHSLGLEPTPELEERRTLPSDLPYLPSPPQDTCDYQISDGKRGVRQLDIVCSEGRIDWHPPHGALRLVIKPWDGVQRPVEVCIMVTNYRSQATVYRQRNGSLHRLHSTAPTAGRRRGKSSRRETCVRSSGGTLVAAEEVVLYVEAESQPVEDERSSLLVQYDVYHPPVLAQDEDEKDDMRECRPCTQDELLMAVCTKDFVVRGQISQVESGSKMEQTRISVTSVGVHRQTQDIFRRPLDGTNTTLTQKHSEFSLLSNSSRDYAGTIIAPGKCGIHAGSGEFVFMGRIRLGRALLQCAPRWQDFTAIWRKRSKQGSVPCDLR